MKFQDEYRDRELVQGIAQAIEAESASLEEPLKFMEVCGTHTMSIARYGIKSLLPSSIVLVSGPGCPVCVTPVDYIDHALELARLPGMIITTFGDLLRVPGSSSSLMEMKAAGGADIRVVYSPLDAVRTAAENRSSSVVFLGVGFETTTPAIAGAILKAEAAGLKNFTVLSSNRTIPGPMAILSSDPELKISGYICPAHVSTVIGSDAYLPLAEQHNVPCVVNGFEPADILQGILMLLRQKNKGIARVENQYSRAVSKEGNQKAQELTDTVFAPCDAVWRGLGRLPSSGLAIKNRFSLFDAACRFTVRLPAAVEPAGCRCGDVLTGRLSPSDCPLFGKACSPENPVGSCMVSSEGSCAAAWRYGIA